MKKVLLSIIVLTSIFLVGCNKNNTLNINTTTWDNSTWIWDTWTTLEDLIDSDTINEYIPLWYTYVGKRDLYKIYFDNTYRKLDNQSQFAPSDFVFYNQDDTLSAIIYTDNDNISFEAYARKELDKYNKIWSWYTILSSWSWSVDNYNYIDVTFENTQEDIKLTNRLIIIKLDNVYLNLVFVTSSEWYQLLKPAINWLIKWVSLVD